MVSTFDHKVNKIAVLYETNFGLLLNFILIKLRVFSQLIDISISYF